MGEDALAGFEVLHKPRPSFVRLSDVTPRELEWLWQDRIPAGKITNVAGPAKLGKSTVMLDIGARVTVGAEMPDGTPGPGCGGVLILAPEDDIEDTIYQRLELAGADRRRVVSMPNIDGPPVALSRDIEEIQRVIIEEDVKLVIVDAIMQILGGIDTHKDAPVRQALAPLVALARRTRAAVALVRHWSKSGGDGALNAGGGSIAFNAVGRSLLTVAEHPEQEGRMVVASRCNTAAQAASWGYEFVVEGQHTRIEWTGPEPYSDDDLVRAAKRKAEQPPSVVPDDDVVVVGVRELLSTANDWKGTMTELDLELRARMPEAALDDDWPSSPRDLAARIRRAKRSLQQAGIDVVTPRDPGGGRGPRGEKLYRLRRIVRSSDRQEADGLTV